MARAATSGGASALRVEVVRELADLERLREEWSELFAVSPTASPPLAFDWLHTWWRVFGGTYGARASGLRVFTVRRGCRLVAALPLYQLRRRALAVPYRRLAFVSTGEAQHEETCPEYLDLLVAPGEEVAGAEALLAALIGGHLASWDRIELHDIVGGSPLLRWRGHTGPAVHLTVAMRGVCPIADVSSGIEAYLMRLPSRRRTQPRRILREIDTTGARFEVASTSEEAARCFDTLVALHQSRWAAAGMPGVFSAPRFTRFHRELARLWVPDGRAVLCRLTLDEQPLAAIAGFRVGEKFHFYQMGTAIDDAAPLKSPGLAVHLCLMRHLAARGVRHYDFLRGASTYKERLATEETVLWSLTLERDGVRTRALAAQSLATRAARHSLRWARAQLLRRGMVTPPPLEGRAAPVAVASDKKL